MTASVDKMELKKPIRVDTDLNIAGAVTYVGRSSIDIQIEVTQIDQGILFGDITTQHRVNYMPVYLFGV